MPVPPVGGWPCQICNQPDRKVAHRGDACEQCQRDIAAWENPASRMTHLCVCGHPESLHKSNQASWPHPLIFGVCLVPDCGCPEFTPIKEQAA